MQNLTRDGNPKCKLKDKKSLLMGQRMAKCTQHFGVEHSLEWIGLWKENWV